MAAPLIGVAAAAAARLVAKKLASNAAKKTVKATVKKKVVSGKRQAFDGPVSRSSAKDVIPKMGKDNLQISKNVAIKNAKSPSGRVSIRGGAGQVMSQNVRASLKNVTKAEAKANARGLKAANKPTKASKVMKKATSAKKMENVPSDVSARFAATNARLAKEAAKKTVGNPPNLVKAEVRMIDSVARGGGVKGPLGKSRDARVFNSKKIKKSK